LLNERSNGGLSVERKSMKPEPNTPRRVTKAQRAALLAPPSDQPAAATFGLADNSFSEINLDLIDPDLDQPRKFFDEQKIAELADSINADEPGGKKRGVIQPIIVRPAAGGRYKIVVGERRWRAARLAGLLTIPVIVREMGDDEALDLQLAENADRDDLHPLETAAAYQRQLERPGMSLDKLSAKVARDKRTVRRWLSLNNLAPEARAAFAENKILLGHALELARLTAEQQPEALEACFNYDAELVTVTDLREWIEDELFLGLGDAPFDVIDAELVIHAGPCSLCPKRTGSQSALFDDIDDKDTCTDPACYESKTQAHIAARRAVVQANEGREPLRVTAEWNAPEEGVLRRGQYTRAVPGECEHTQPAVLENRNEAGVAIHVCAAQGCETHQSHIGYTSAETAEERHARQQKEAAEKRAETLREATRAQAFRALCKQEIRLDTPEVLSLIALRVWHSIGGKGELMKLFGWSGESWEPKVIERIVALRGSKQTAFIATCLLAGQPLHTYVANGVYRNEFAEALPRFGLDWAALERQALIALELEAARKKPLAPAGGYVREFGIAEVREPVSNSITEIMVYRDGDRIAAIIVESEKIEVFPTLADFSRATGLIYIGDAFISDEELREWTRDYEADTPFAAEFENRRARLAQMETEGNGWTELAGSLRAYLEKWQPAYNELKRVWDSFSQPVKNLHDSPDKPNPKDSDLFIERREAIKTALKQGRKVTFQQAGSAVVFEVSAVRGVISRQTIWVMTSGGRFDVRPEDALVIEEADAEKKKP
jgi:ParB family chromosome partitioning protein